MTRCIACILAVAVLAGCGLAGSALAGPSAPPKPPPMPRLFLSPAGEPFRLGPNDPDPLKAWFDQADSAHQGYLDRAEFRADAVRFFKTLDENSDGVVDGFELADYEHKLVPELTLLAEGRFAAQAPAEPSNAAPPPGPPRDSYPHGHPSLGETQANARSSSAARHPRPPQRTIVQLIDEPEPVSGADFNMDSHVTLAEWKRATDDRFDLLDTGHTGRLTLDALRTRMNASLQPPRR
jgi:Ca2+-binding EF-hand superfamily protein